MQSDLLVNGQMEIDDLNEGAEVTCRNALDSSTPVASRWYVQFLATGAEARAQRVRCEGPRGPAWACRITMARPADRVVDLDRIQLFQPIMWDDLIAIGLDSDFPAEQGGFPLVMRFSIKTNIDIQVGCTLNNATGTCNWTTNRPVRANHWHEIEIAIPSHAAARFPLGPAGFGLYFQIGLSCGPARLSAIDSVWNDGHYLMLNCPDSSDFLKTAGATALIASCSLSVGGILEERQPESLPLATAQVRRYEEKSYRFGVRPGTPNTIEGADQLSASSEGTRAEISFEVKKHEPPNRHSSKLYSPATGSKDCVYDMTAGRDVSASIIDTSRSGMVISIPDSVAGHIYRYHWRATTLV